MKSRRVFGSTAGYASSYNVFVPPAARCMRPLRKLRAPDEARQCFNYPVVPTRCFQTTTPLRQTWKVDPPVPPSIHPHSSTTESLPMSEQLRAVMRLLPHSVVVCTSTAPAAQSSPPSPRAMTMSSFTSLTLSPAPVVAFNIATPSRTLDALKTSGRFNVHVLEGGAAGARVADWFTQGNDQRRHVFEGLSRCGVELASASSKGAAGETRGLEPPVLKGDGILYIIRCKLLDEPTGGLIKVRDHVIVLGEVVEIIEGSGKSGVSRGDDCFGLIYADRRYRQPGNTLVKSDRDGTGRCSEPKS